MIPLKLRVHNFLCYTESTPVLDLEGVHVACLSGENGAGKSALLDAMAWALWGRARTKNNDDLVHHGKEYMEVELEFLTQEMRYKVFRRHSRRKGGNLQLSIRSNGGWHVISDSAMRLTQSRLERLLGMDYETFINSAFLVQGRADEFTNKPPDERKKTLAKLLGLDRFDELQELAKKRLSEKALNMSSLETRIEVARHELEKRSSLLDELRVIAAQLKEASLAHDSLDRQVEELRRRMEDLKRLQQGYEEIQAKVQKTQSELARWNEELRQRLARVAESESILKSRHTVQEEYQRLLSAKARAEELQRLYRKVQLLLQERQPLLQRIESERVQLETLAHSITGQVKKLEERVSTLPGVQKRYQVELVPRRSGLEKEEQSLAERRQALTGPVNREGELKASLAQVERQGKELRAKLDALQLSHDQVKCPVCQTELGTEGCQRLVQAYTAEREECANEFRQLKGELQNVERKRSHEQQAIASLEKELQNRRNALQASLARAQKEMDDISVVQDELLGLTTSLQETKNNLASEDFTHTERLKLKELDAKLAAISFTPYELESVETQLAELSSAEEKWRRLQNAEQELPKLKRDVEAFQSLISSMEHELAQGSQRLEQINTELQKQPLTEANLSKAEKKLEEVRQEIASLQEKKGGLERELQRLARLEAEVKEHEGVLKKLMEQKGLYETLVEAFGRSGVQALLIDSALPRIQERANLLLGRITQGRMHVQLTTQRETKGGNVRETLDIHIADELGTRSYETFSGGEAFRINLALRIALSQVLAERKGLPQLPTLFIDEGFGTQDTAGRERIIDIIQAIQQDFKQILVISHMDDVREAFPVRIEVEKTPTGSTFRMV